MTGLLIRLQMKTVDLNFTMTNVDVQRIGKNCGYMIRSLPKLEEDKCCEAATAVLEHHFDNHKHCGAWCKRRTMTPLQQHESGGHCRSKEKDAKLCGVLSDLMARFVEFKRLKEVAHGVDTNTNESINNAISYFAPKNWLHCSTRSLQTRAGIAVGVILVGYMTHFKRLFKALGIPITPNTLHFLEAKDRNRRRRLENVKKTSTKKLRMKRKFEQLKQLEAAAKMAHQKREGIYKSGGHMEACGFDGDQ